jgi:hypothetical protein
MLLKLGTEMIRPINDGSIALTYIDNSQKDITWLNGKYPFLSVEVKTLLDFPI